MRFVFKIAVSLLLAGLLIILFRVGSVWRESGKIIRQSGIKDHVSINADLPISEAEKVIAETIFPTTFAEHGFLCPSVKTVFHRSSHKVGVSYFLATQMVSKVEYDKQIHYQFLRLFTACQLENEFDGKVLLREALSNAYFGSGEYGIQVAALSLYNKPVSELHEAEGLALAALVQSPGLRAQPEQWAVHKELLGKRLMRNR